MQCVKKHTADIQPVFTQKSGKKTSVKQTSLHKLDIFVMAQICQAKVKQFAPNKNLATKTCRAGSGLAADPSINARKTKSNLNTSHEKD